jgi:hypothetical protein
VLETALEKEMRAVANSDVETDIDQRGRPRRIAKRNAQFSIQCMLRLPCNGYYV